ncbi:rhodanese-like domain-containing protein [Yoonia sp. SS1-5]|uniref:Rhodanese-like domain-containing protein n=1 Tax=Yoonia rhodophyticola TaxID=3137370 RepID=A0AAN0MGT1_9RHOB
MRLSRRAILGGVGLGGAAAVVAMANPNLLYTLITEDVDGVQLSAPDAHAQALAGQITLIDIRRPDEWARTGSGQGAHRVDLRRDDFVTVLDGLTNGDRAAPIALICARGVRSARTANRLAEAGFTNIIDVPEGMLGSAAGPGWLARDLPLNRDP